MAGNALLKRFAVTIDLKRPVAIRPFEVVEGDTGNLLELTLTDDGSPMDLTGCAVKAVFSTSAGISVQESGDGSVEIDGGTVTIELDPSSFAPGMVECELQLYSTSGEVENDVLITTAKFNFGCRRAILNGESIEHTTQFPLLTGLMQDIAEAEPSRAAAEAAREEAEASREYYETARRFQEEIRISNENARITTEVSRIQAETLRANAETERASAESARAQAELARAHAEHLRAEAETLRAEAETAREAAFQSMMADISAGAEAVEEDPEDELEPMGKLVISESTGATFISCAEEGAETGSWKRFAYDNPWQDVLTTTLRSDSASFVAYAEDDEGESISYDEMRVTLIGAMKNSSAVNIYINGDNTCCISDSAFLAKNVSDITKCAVVMHLKKPRLGIIETERRKGGVAEGSSSSTNAVHSGILVTNETGYSSVRIAASASNGLFAAGTRIIVEGRNLI